MRLWPTLALILTTGLAVSPPSRAQTPEAASRPIPVLFVPLTVDKPFAAREEVLRELLSTRMPEFSGRRHCCLHVVPTPHADSVAKSIHCDPLLPLRTPFRVGTRLVLI
jgi:hypothetical protein